jgi:hypothetical protein
MRRIESTAWLWIAGALVACGGGSSDLFDNANGGPVTGEGGEGAETASGGDSGNSGGATGSGGAATTGGRAQGGSSSGGASSGGATTTGGRAEGGNETGGSDAGGESSGGESSAGESSGGMSGGMSSGGTSNGGTSNGGTSTGGATGVGGKNTGGTGGMAMKCSDPDGADYQTRGTAKGTNGSFQDKCVEGELVEYLCETQVVTGPCELASAADGAAFRPIGGGPSIAPPIDCQVQTGKVIESHVDCDGRCRDGTCFYWCPDFEDEVEYQDVQGGEVLFENTRTHSRYRCEATFEQGGYDCTDPDLEGRTASVVSLGTCNTTQVVFGTSTGKDQTQNCTYSCVVVD